MRPLSSTRIRACGLFPGSPFTRRERTALGLVLGAAVGLRAFVALAAAGARGNDYYEIANNLASGRGFSLTPGVPTPFRGPIYPGFLAVLLKWFGESSVAVPLVQGLLTSALCLVVYAVARRILGARVALASAAVLAVSPSLLTFGGMWSPEALDAVLLGVAGWALVAAFRGERGTRRRLILFAIAGALMGVKTLNRPITLAFPIAVAIGLWFLRHPRRQVLSATLAFTGAMVAVIAPWTLRNFVEFHRLIPVSADLGVALLGSEHWAGGLSDIPDREIFADRTYRPITEDAAGSDARWTSLAASRILRHPLEYAFAVGKRAVKFWYGYAAPSVVAGASLEGGGVSTRRAAAQHRWGVVALRAAWFVPEYLILVLAAAGAWISRQRWRDWFPVALVLGYTWMAYAAVHVTPRYKVPLAPFVALFAGVAIARIIGRTRRAAAPDDCDEVDSALARMAE